MKVLSNLTKAIVIYLLKFKKTLVAYENFIEAIKNKMNLIKDPSNKHKYL